MNYEKKIKQEIEAMKAKRGFVQQTADSNALCDTIDELCAFTVRKQMDNQLHTPDDFCGIKDIKTKPFAIACDAYSGECKNLVKDNDGHWNIATTSGTTLPAAQLPIEALRTVAITMLDTIAGIHAWELEWM